jgi:hypothetical protein
MYVMTGEGKVGWLMGWASPFLLLLFPPFFLSDPVVLQFVKLLWSVAFPCLITA